MIKPALDGVTPMRGRIDPSRAGKSWLWDSAIRFSVGVSLPVVRKRRVLSHNSALLSRGAARKFHHAVFDGDLV